MLSLSAQFLAWCRSKPADEEYEYFSNRGCALAQFLLEHGMAAKPSVGGVTWGDLSYQGGTERHDIPDSIRETLNGGQGRPTFGALADRLAERVERQLVATVNGRPLRGNLLSRLRRRAPAGLAPSGFNQAQRCECGEPVFDDGFCRACFDEINGQFGVGA